MADVPDLIPVQDVEDMTAAQRSALIKKSFITDLDTLDEHTAAVVERGRARIVERIQGLST